MAVYILLPQVAHAHGGGLNSEGCHTNRKTGDYHCHRAPASHSHSPAPAYQPRSAYAPPATSAHAPSPNHAAPNTDVNTNSYTAQQAAPRTTRVGRRADGAFINCRAAREAGAAPVRRGQSGYGSHLDRDGDGLGCEPYHGPRY